MSFGIEILIGIVWILGSLLTIWGWNSRIRGDINKQYDAEIVTIVPWAAFIFGALLFLPCAIHFSMVLTHYYGLSKQACWEFGILLILGQVIAAYLLIQVGKGIIWFVTMIWFILVMVIWVGSVDEEIFD